MDNFTLRDNKGWLANGLPMSSTSDTACKMFDAALLQVYGSHAFDTWGNTSQTIESMLKEDPEFVMGHVLDASLSLLMGNIPRSDVTIRNKLDNLQYLQTKKPHMNDWELQHIEAVQYLADGQLRQACDTWQNILLEYPKDALCPRLVYNTMSFQGTWFSEMRDLLERSTAAFNHTEPVYGYLLGLYGFSLEQTFNYDKAEKVTKEALSIYPDSTASTHSLCHVLDATARHEQGLDFLVTTAQRWQNNGGISCHLFWHKALYYIKKGDFKEALEVYDSEVARRCKENDGLCTIGLRDGVTLLYRLKLEGVNAGPERWRQVGDICRRHMTNHTLALTDAHIMLGLSGSDDVEDSQQFLKSIRDITASDDTSTIAVVSRVVNLALCESITAFEDTDYERAVNILFPVRDKVINIGGSNAQRDFFNQMLINAAILSSDPDHQILAKQLLAERREVKDTLVADRLTLKLLQRHDAQH